MVPFKQRFPWVGGDLQTLRDTFHSDKLPLDTGEKIEIVVPKNSNGRVSSGKLLALLDLPKKNSKLLGLVLMLHGLGGSSKRSGLRRMGLLLQRNGFAVLRLNLRGAGPSRHLASGTYAANCTSDIFPVLLTARELCKQIAPLFSSKAIEVPLLGAGISLGGTILMNACLDLKKSFTDGKSPLDGLICTSSPLDLAECSKSIEKPRNRIYQYWLLKRLVFQTFSDPFGVINEERKALLGENSSKKSISSIRDFDEAITAPRWGYLDVDDYYSLASPLNSLLEDCSSMPPTFVLQSKDDPWVPSDSAIKLKKEIAYSKNSLIDILLTTHGGHNGFHGINGCWGDQVVLNWFRQLVQRLE